jgi:hypothetical protein
MELYETAVWQLCSVSYPLIKYGRAEKPQDVHKKDKGILLHVSLWLNLINCIVQYMFVCFIF